MLKWTTGLLLMGLILMGSCPKPVWSADMKAGARHHHVVRHHHWVRLLPRLPPERHVVEAGRPPGSGVFQINNTRFAAASASCARWVAGEQVKLLAGEWHGACTTAVFYNFRRHQTCQMACQGAF